VPTADDDNAFTANFLLKDHPERAVFLLRPDGQLCKPLSAEMPHGRYGVGTARVTGGVLFCGGRTVVDAPAANDSVRGERSLTSPFRIGFQCLFWDASTKRMTNLDLRSHLPYDLDDDSSQYEI